MEYIKLAVCVSEALWKQMTRDTFLHQYNDLMKKKRIVENDKAKILQTIEELDQKKNEALNVAWQKVCSISADSFWLI